MSPRERKARQRLEEATTENGITHAECNACHGKLAYRQPRRYVEKLLARWEKEAERTEREYRRALAALLRVVREEARNGK